MNFAAMLMQTADAKQTPTGRAARRPRTMEAVEAHRQSVRNNRNKKWKAAFMNRGNEVSAADLAAELECTVYTVNSMMRYMRKETPPLVEKVGEVFHPKGRKPAYIYRWIGD